LILTDSLFDEAGWNQDWLEWLRVRCFWCGFISRGITIRFHLFIAHQSQCGLTSVYCVLIIFVECLCGIKYIFNYLCNQYLSPLKLWVRIPLRRGVLDTTFCDKVMSVTCNRFSPGTPVSSTNKTDCHGITEILLKVVLKHHNPNPKNTDIYLIPHKHSTNIINTQYTDVNPWRKSVASHWHNFITKCCIEYTSPEWNSNSQLQWG
jgi:hypothetical protein